MNEEDHNQRQHYTPLWVTDRQAKAIERFLDGKMLYHHGDLELVQGILRALLKTYASTLIRKAQIRKGPMNYEVGR